MAERSFPLENTLYTAEEASLWFAPRTSGVHASNVLGVTASDGLSVTVAPGIAWLKYAEFAGVAYGNTEAKRLQLDAASTNYPRIDRIVIRYSKSENNVYLAVRKGTAGSTPAAPDIVRDSSTYEISLAQVYVAANATSITASNITDERLNNSVCGLMSDGVTPYINEGVNGGLPATEDSAHPGCYYLLANGTLEWINPPMLLDEEYRTTERHNGKPVFTKLIAFGVLPNATEKVVGHNIYDLDLPLSVSVVAKSDSWSFTLPSSYANETAVLFNSHGVQVTTTIDRSTYSAFALLRYTKL